MYTKYWLIKFKKTFSEQAKLKSLKSSLRKKQTKKVKNKTYLNLSSPTVFKQLF